MSERGPERRTEGVNQAIVSDLSGAHLIAWRPHHWYTWMFEVDRHVVGSNETVPWQIFEGQNNIFGKEPTPKTDTEAVKFLGTFKTQHECAAACNSAAEKPASIRSTSA